MLIYSRKGTMPGGIDSPQMPLEIPNPPARAWDVVRELNAAHDEACETYQIRLVCIRLSIFGIHLCCTGKRISNAGSRKHD
jgi:hypothetical protein